ncbi:hypothetical protein VTK56DRAFT_10248 [Thermocarpiscus australiensis]
MAAEDRDSTFEGIIRECSATNGPATLARKRKSPQNDTESSLSEATSPRGGGKRAKLAEGRSKQSAQLPATDFSMSADKSLLSPEVWHHIFTFCPPKSLGNLLAVNKLFNLYLDPASSVHREVPLSVNRGVLSPLRPNAIWQASRRLFWPQMPGPLRSKTELDMWRLACSRRCQECGKLDIRKQASPLDPQHPGPGPEGVVAVWAFGRRMCAPCLLKQSVKEVDLLLSPSIPSAVMPALPFIFLTQELHVFSATALEQGHLPAGTEVTKLFSSSDVEALKQEFLAVKDMGPGTASEWLKGLVGRGSDLQHDATKWEKWEYSGGTAKMRSQLYPGYVRQSPAFSTQRQPTNLPAPLPKPHLPSVPRQFLPTERQERTAEEVAQLKAARKAEIERRALRLDPPLTPDVLHRIPAFQAATQIVTPLDDNAWEVLKPRLLAQRADAEILESKSTSQTKVKHEISEHGRLETTLATTKEARDRIDKDWEEAQAPLRARIAGYADEIIRDSWGNGEKVTKENCSRFAVDALLYVRRRFYAEVAKDAAAARAAGKTPHTDPPQGPFTQKLTLENMKWIFDTKIKPHTESLRKELFYCSGCDANSKTFGFEGVIQHYAAKHTNVLSFGNIVVHWRAEWPEQLPFSAEARPAKPPMHRRAPGDRTVNGGPLPLANYGYQPVAAVPAAVPAAAPAAAPAPPPAYPPDMGYGYNMPAHHGHYQPPPPAQPYQPYLPHPSHAPALPFTPHPGYEGQSSYAAPPAPYQPYQQTAVAYPAPAVEPAAGYVPPQSQLYDYNYGSYQTNAGAGGTAYALPQPPMYPNLYQTKLEDIARNSRQVWRQLGDIKGLPGSVRAFVTIHHMVKRFRSRFYETPPLTMFIDGLSNNKEMRPVRNVNGLVCKACHLGLGNAASVEQDRKHFSLPQLVNHFQTKHVEPMQKLQTQNMGPPLDWVLDMVLLPDLPVIATLSVNDTQRSLLAAALPCVFESQPVPATASSCLEQPGRQYGPVRAGGLTPTPANDREESYSQPPRPLSGGSHAVSHGATGLNPVAAGRPGGGLLANHRSAGQSPASTTPAMMPENGRSAHSMGGRHSSQGFRPVRGQDEVRGHKKAASKDKYGKADGSGVPGNRLSGTISKGDEEKALHGELDVRDMPITLQRETPHARSFPTKPEQPGMAGGMLLIRPATQTASQPLQHSEGDLLSQKRPATLADGKEESSVVPPSQSHLERRHSALFQGQQQVPRAAPYTDSGGIGASLNPKYESRMYALFGESETPTEPGTYRFRYHAPSPAGRAETISGRQPEVVYHPKAGLVDAREEGYRMAWAQPELVEPPPRYAEEARSGWPGPRRDDRGQDPAPPEAGYRRYREGMRTESRPPPIEAYEIVHVIDEHGEYYIRRPVRREADIRYRYEEHGAHRDGVSYPAPASNRVSDSGPSLDRDTVRGPVASEAWPAGRRADPAYYEEYDPRFPAA